MRARTRTAVALTGGALVLLGTLAGAPARSAAATTTGTSFTQGLPLLDAGGSNTGAAEPSIKVDSGGHVYVTGPVGVPTGGCPLWYIHPDSLNAHNLAYEYRGKFDTDHGAPGGGDCDIATGGLAPANGFDNLAVSSLSLADITVNQSADGGSTFHTPANPLGNQTPGDDRQWNAADTGLGQVYTTVHDAGTDNIQISSSTDGGYTYTSNVPAIQTTPNSCGLPSGCFSAATMDNHFGNLVINPTTHMLYTVYVAPANAQENAAAQQQGASPNEHVVYVAVGNPCAVSCTAGQPLGPITWTDYAVYTAPTGDDLAHIFPSIAIDAAGAVYVTYSDTHRVYLLRSTKPDTGSGWTKPVPMSGTALHSVMFPWVVGGAAGVVDLVMYAATLNPSNPACASGTEPKDDSQGVNNNCHDQWDVDYVQARYAAGSNHPTLTKADTKSSTIHNGSLCDQGLTCTTGGGDRTLLDFFQVALDPLGAANIAYASDVATPGAAQIMYARQCTGPSATTSHAISYPCNNLKPPPPPKIKHVCSGTNVVTDAAGDASNPTGAPGDTSQMDILDVSFATDSTAKTLTATMTVSNLTSPPQPLAGTADSYYYVVWSYGGTQYAALASEPQPDSTAYSYGTFNSATNQLSTSNAATGVLTAGTPGTIAITVPLSGVGNPTIPTTTLATAAVQNPYALTISGEGALGAGLVFTHPDDRAPNSSYGPAWSVC